MAYNKDQWIDSFEGQLSILRPHLSERMLPTLGISAWHNPGTKDVDLIQAAREESALMNQYRGQERSK